MFEYFLSRLFHRTSRPILVFAEYVQGYKITSAYASASPELLYGITVANVSLVIPGSSIYPIYDAQAETNMPDTKTCLAPHVDGLLYSLETKSSLVNIPSVWMYKAYFDWSDRVLSNSYSINRKFM